MKTLIFNKPTNDIDGLLVELRKEIGPVISVASDPRKTYIYVADDSPLDVGQAVNEWEDVPKLRVESTNQVGSDGIATVLADGKEIHTFVIQKTTGYGDLISDATKLIASVSQGKATSQRKLNLKNGVASITLGPSRTAGDAVLEVQDARKRMTPVTVTVRFASASDSTTDATNKPLTIKVDEEKVGLWAKLKRILGIGES